MAKQKCSKCKREFTFTEPTLAAKRQGQRYQNR